MIQATSYRSPAYGGIIERTLLTQASHCPFFSLMQVEKILEYSISRDHESG